MMTIAIGRPRHRPATDEDAARDVYRMVARSAHNKRRPAPVTLGTCRSEDRPADILGKASRR